MSLSARRAYVDRPVGDLRGATATAQAAAQHWHLDEPLLVRRGMNAIFASGDVVLRAASPSVPAGASIDLAEFLRSLGVRVPAPRRADVFEHDGLSVTAWERIDDTGEPVDWAEVGAMVRRVHTIDPRTVPESVPVPHPSVLPWWDFDTLLERVGGGLDESARAGLRAAVERNRGWERAEDAVVCHGDVHPGNVMTSTDGPVLLDWDLLCLAPPGWDHGPLLTWFTRWGGAAGIYRAYAAGYGCSFADDPVAVAVAELRLVAATLMRVLAALDDPSAGPEAERRLRYWRGDPDAPPWTAQ